MSSTTTPPADSPQSRRYNQIRRWLGITDFVVGFALLIILLATGWNGALRDLALRAVFQNYTLAVALYVLMLMGLAKVFGIGLDYYGFRLEHRFHLSNQRLRAWIMDEVKEFLVGLDLHAFRYLPVGIRQHTVGGDNRVGLDRSRLGHAAIRARQRRRDSAVGRG